MSFGANDTAIEAGGQRVEADRSHSALKTILDRAATIGLPVLVVGPAPVDDSEQNRQMQALSSALGEICAEGGSPFVSIIEQLLDDPNWFKQIGADDGAHPGAAG